MKPGIATIIDEEGEIYFTIIKSMDLMPINFPPIHFPNIISPPYPTHTGPTYTGGTLNPNWISVPTNIPITSHTQTHTTAKSDGMDCSVQLEILDVSSEDGIERYVPRGARHAMFPRFYSAEDEKISAEQQKKLNKLFKSYAGTDTMEIGNYELCTSYLFDHAARRVTWEYLWSDPDKRFLACKFNVWFPNQSSPPQPVLPNIGFKSRTEKQVNLDLTELVIDSMDDMLDLFLSSYKVYSQTMAKDYVGSK